MCVGVCRATGSILSGAKMKSDLSYEFSRFLAPEQVINISTDVTLAKDANKNRVFSQMYGIFDEIHLSICSVSLSSSLFMSL